MSWQKTILCAQIQLFMLNSFLVIVLSAPIGNALKNNNKIFMVGIGSALIGGGTFILSMSFAFTIAIIACVIYTCGEIIFFSFAQLLCYEKASNQSKGRSMGAYRMVFAGSRIIGPAAGGAISYHFSGNFIWYISGLTGLMIFYACNKFKSLN